MSRRYAPYYPRNSALHTPASDTTPLVRAAHSSLLANNAAGLLSTWDHLALEWCMVPRPQREQSGNLVDIAASGLRNVWKKHESPFLCRHTNRAGNPHPPMTLHLNAAYLTGERADFFQSKDHQCRFKGFLIHIFLHAFHSQAYLVVLIPRLKHRVTFTSQQDIDDFNLSSESSLSSSSQDSTRTSSTAASSTTTSSTASSTTATSTSTASSGAPSKADIALARHPVTPPPSPFRPRPTPLLPGAEQPPVRSYFSAEVAQARAQNGDCLSLSLLLHDRLKKPFPDNDLRDYIQECQRAGIFNDEPYAHPLAGGDLPFFFYKGQEFFSSELGLAIRYLVSPLGLPWNVYSTLIDHCRACTGCHCLFSVAGYNSHLTEEGHCGNTPSRPLVTRHSTASLPTFKFRTYRKTPATPAGSNVPMLHRLNTPTHLPTILNDQILFKPVAKFIEATGRFT
ncbi:hypothetical protein C8J57DRAFT_1217149 [Mycena rebaudengoi]|nr:hypothetical protein C8J57DRAFT_1217149 [Mycena rebaudengoi]